MDFQLSSGQFRAIAPFADMFNHSPDVEICHIYHQPTNTLRVLAGADYNIGDQVRITSSSIEHTFIAYLTPNNIPGLY